MSDELTRTGALRGGERALLLLSGGADSMALLSLLRAADRRLELGLDLAALHVDYGLRGADSDRDRRIVERACAAVGVPLHVELLRGRLSGSDFQSRARDARYGRARQLAADHGYDVVVTAHNRDDQAETVLYRLVKYASPRGLAGMRPRDGDLARPLLCAGGRRSASTAGWQAWSTGRTSPTRRRSTRATCCVSRSCPCSRRSTPAWRRRWRPRPSRPQPRRRCLRR